jgi:hypothetical protein
MATIIETRMNKIARATAVATGTDFAAIFLKSIPGQILCIYGFTWGIKVTVAADGPSVVNHTMHLYKAPDPTNQLTLNQLLALTTIEEIYSECIGEDGGKESDFSVPFELEPGYSYLAVVGDLVLSAAIANPELFICVRGDSKPLELPPLRGQESEGSMATMESILNV